MSDNNEALSKRKKTDLIFEKLRYPTMSVDDFSEGLSESQNFLHLNKYPVFSNVAVRPFEMVT